MDSKYKEILDGAMRMFFNIGIRSVSIDDIARELHISKKTFYLYFKNKEELITEILKYHQENELHGYECISFEENLNAIDVLLKVSESICKHFKETNHGHVFELQKYYPEQFKNFWNTKRERIKQRVKDNIEKGIQQNLYRKDLLVDVVTKLYTKRLEDFSDLENLLNEKYTFEQIFTTMFEYHIRGISNENGLQYFEQKKKDLQF